MSTALWLPEGGITTAELECETLLQEEGAALPTPLRSPLLLLIDRCLWLSPAPVEWAGREEDETEDADEDEDKERDG